MHDMPDGAVAPAATLRWWERAENAFAVLILAVMAIIPVVSVSYRWLTGESLGSANVAVQCLNLWIAFFGGTIAARSNRHLALSTGTFFKLDDTGKAVLSGFTSAVATACAAYLAWGSAGLVMAERGSSSAVLGSIPTWAIETVMPVGFAVMAVHFAVTGNKQWPGRLAALLTVLLAGGIALVPPESRGPFVWIGALILFGALVLGAPLFTTLGGLTMLLFVGAPVPISISAVPAETYTIVASPMLPSLPLFTMGGYLMAEGGASKRLVRVIRAWFGWLPGGSAIAAILVCAFFTTFTGASGVTILALGGLLLPIMTAAGYKERYGIGLLTAAGSLGLLFPPSLPVILYGVASQVPIDKLFLGGAVPGIVLMLLLIGMVVFRAVQDRSPRSSFEAKVAAQALWEAKWELALPILVMTSIFGGFMTLFESAAWAAAYAFLSEVVVHRDLSLRKDVPRVLVESATLMGAVMIILGMALGFTNYLVDAEIPMKLTAYVQAHVGSRWAFILILNVVLLFMGSLMEVYSAIMVLVPLIVPISQAFGIDPVHLGILFLANLELGYLTPPVGLNLLLSSYRFKVPLVRVYRDVLPFFAVLLFGVFFISYVPSVTTWAIGETKPAGNFFEDEPAAGAQGTGATPEGAGPKPLDPAELQKMLEEDGGGAAPTEGAAPADGSAPTDGAAAKPLKTPDPAELQKMLEEDDGAPAPTQP
jgi:tripartite ATP-independent transporter DctM subunit